MAAWDAHPNDPPPSHRRIPLTPSRAWCSALDAANTQMRKACRTEWSNDDWNKAVETQARLLKYLGPPWDAIAADMLRASPYVYDNEVERIAIFDSSRPIEIK